MNLGPASQMKLNHFLTFKLASNNYCKNDRIKISNRFFETWSCFSEAFIIAISEHVAGIEIVYSFAFDFSTLVINIFIAGISCLQVESLSDFRTGEIKFLEKLSRWFFHIVEFDWPAGSSSGGVFAFHIIQFLGNRYRMQSLP